MKITVTTASDLIFVLDVADDLELENFKAFCEVESGIPSGQIGVAYNGQLLMDDKKPLKEYGLSDGDVVVIDSVAQGSGGGGGASGKWHLYTDMRALCMSIFEYSRCTRTTASAATKEAVIRGSFAAVDEFVLFSLSCCHLSLSVLSSWIFGLHTYLVRCSHSPTPR